MDFLTGLFGFKKTANNAPAMNAPAPAANAVAMPISAVGGRRRRATRRRNAKKHSRRAGKK